MNQSAPDQTDLHGLSQDEVQVRLRAEGSNELPASSQHNILTIALEVLREPMFLLLVAAGAIYLLLGELWFELYKLLNIQ